VYDMPRLRRNCERPRCCPGPTASAAMFAAPAGEHRGPEGERAPGEQTQQRLRVGLQVALMLNQSDGPEVTQAWFQGLNPQLEDRSPARLLRDGDLQEAGPAVIAAACAFLVGG
jgi:hypothetical protein